MTETRYLLHATNLFSSFDAEALDRLVRTCERRRYRPGEIIVREGELGDSMFLVTQGLLEVLKAEGLEQQAIIGTLMRGQHFGEMSLLNSSRRTATVRTREEAEVLIIPHATMMDLLADYPHTREILIHTLAERHAAEARRGSRPSLNAIAEHLRAMTTIDDADTLASVARQVDWFVLPAAETLFREGDPGDCLYFVVDGQLEVFVKEEAGEERSIAIVGVGEVVGEMAVLSKASRSATVRASRQCQLLRMSCATLDALVAQHPRALRPLSETLAVRLQRQLSAQNVLRQIRAHHSVHAEACEEVANTCDFVLRNLKITQTYYELSTAIAGVVSHRDANWCTYATHASKTAGYSIRAEELPFYDLLAAARRSRPVTELGRRWSRTTLLSEVRSLLDEVSMAISAGNLKVFRELSPVFCRFVSVLDGAKQDRDKAFDGLLASLRRGSTATGGQDLLRDALQHYRLASIELEEKRRSELILLGNCKIGLHEQTRLQPDIVAGLNAPVRRFLQQSLRRWPLGEAARERIVRTMLGAWRRFLTRWMMRIRLPYGEVALGRDLPLLMSDRVVPEVLQTLKHPELVALYRRFDRSDEHNQNSGATDWGDLDDRMNFIVNLFRSRQKSLELFSEPFLYDQRSAVRHDIIPKGKL